MASMYSTSYVKEFAMKGVVAAGFAIVVDAVVEVSGIPFFNSNDIFGGNNEISNYELFAYGISGAVTILSLLDILLNSKPFGISKEALPYSTFFIIGTSLWETTLAKMVGLRNINIYDILGNTLGNTIGGVRNALVPAA